MHLLRIEASNFRQLKEVEVHFPETGFIGITGDNGAGKSTILNLLDWTFYGKYKDVTQKELKTYGVPKNASTYTIVDFVFNGNFYRVRRDLSASNSKNFVQKNGNTEAVGTTQINDYIKNDLFKTDQETFRTSYYAAQDEFDALVKLNDAPRIRMISRFFKIDTIDVAAEQARKDRRAIEIQIEEFKRHLKDEDAMSQQINETKSRLTLHETELKTIENEIFDLEKKRVSAAEEKEASDKKFDAFREINSSISNLSIKKETLVENSLKSAVHELKDLEAKQKRLSEISKSKDKYFELIQRKDSLNEEKEQYLSIQRLHQQAIEIKNYIEQYEQTLSLANEKIASFEDVEKQTSKLETLINNKEGSLSNMRDEVQELLTILKLKKEEYENKKNEIEKFQSLGTGVPCPACKQPLGQEHYDEELNKLQDALKTVVLEIKTKKTTYEKLSETGVKQKQELDKLKEELKVLQSKLSTKSGFVARKESAETEIKKQQSLLGKLKSEREKFPEKINFNPEEYKALLKEIETVTPLYEEVIQLSKAVEKIPLLKENITNLQKQIDRLSDEISSKNNELSQLEFDKELHQKVTSNLEEVRNKIESQKDKKYVAQSKVDMSKNNIQNLEKELEEIQNKKKELKEKQEEVLLLTKLDQLYKTYKTDKLSKIAPTLSDLMSDMIESLTDGRYDRAELDDNYKINIYRNGQLQPFEIFSGGEKKLFALCLRLAISQLLVSQSEQGNFDMITLDEVFGSFDEKRQDAMVEMFRNLTDMFNQILVVSHTDHVKQMYDHILHVEFDEKTFTSKVKWLNNDLGQPTFDHNAVEQLVYERYELEEAEV